jgi:amino acid transporter
VFWSFLLLVSVAVIWLRQSDRATDRPFKVPLYPFTPLVFGAACAWLAYSSITYAISRQAIGVSMWLMASGVLAWCLLRWREHRR